MKTLFAKPLFFLLSLLCCSIIAQGQAVAADYLTSLKAALQKKWPQNRTINIVFHGHSVPSGYFRTPEVRTLDAYPFLVLGQLKKRYPNAVINCITTSIGGEHAQQGARRFKKDVLTHRPDLLFIDYALNDRGIGLTASRKAMEKMIKAALKRKIKIILLTPSPDLTESIADSNAKLNRFTIQLQQLAKKYQIGLADSYQAFRAVETKQGNLKDYMAQSNHPNRKGHEVIAAQIMPFFEK